MLTENSKSDLLDLLKKSGVSLLLKLAGGLSSFFVTFTAGRMLGTGGSGLFFLSLAVVTVASAISRLGLDQAITRFVSEAREQKAWDEINGIYVRAQATVCVTSSFISLILFTFAELICESFFDKPEMVSVFRWMSLAIVGFAITWTHARFFQGLQEIKSFQVFQNLGITICFLCFLGFSRFLLNNNLGLPATFGLLFCFASICMAATAHYAWAYTHSWFSWSGHSSSWITIRPTLPPLFGMQLMQQLNTWLPQIVLGFHFAAEEVGVYNASFRIANLTSLVLLGVNGVVYPKFASLHSSGERNRLRALAQTSAKIMTAACLPLLLMLMIWPSQILNLLGDGFSSGAVILRIMAIGQLLNVASGSVAGLLNMTGNQDLGIRCSLAAFTSLVISLLILVPLVGAMGAAISQVLGIAVSMGLFTIACHSRLGFAPLDIGLPSRIRP